MSFIPGGSEMMIFFLIILLLFGASKVPKLARSLGEAINEFKEGSKKKDESKVMSGNPDESPKEE